MVFFNFSFSKTELLDATCVPISPNCWRVDPCNVALEEDVEDRYGELGSGPCLVPATVQELES